MNSDFDEDGFDSLFDEPERETPLDCDFTGITVQGYRFEDRIADQPASQVYLARDIVLQRLVAAKVLKRGDWVSSDCSQRFLSEGRILASLKHPNVVQLLGFSEVQGLPCLFMEYVPDGTLADYLKAPCPPLEAARVLLRIARGVACAHRAGVVHRDLKPQNILVDRSINEPMLQTVFGFVKVTDFGIAKVLEQFESLTLTGMQPGTLIYMSPEQVNSETGRVGTATDVFSLGVILHLLVTAQHPFSGNSVPATLKNILEKQAPSLTELVADVPLWLESLADSCLRKDAAERIPDAQQLADLLDYELQRYTRLYSLGLTSDATPTTTRLSSGTLFLILSFGLLTMAVISLWLRHR